MTTSFDLAVIGLGMIGSAALRALSALVPLGRVVGIGPAEPINWAAHSGAFASHYDHARITRVSDPDHIWATLARRSIEAYGTIEARSNISFHHPVGHLRLGQDDDDPQLAAAIAFAAQLDAPVERLDRAALLEQLPGFRVPNGAVGLHEGGGAGWINPRALVAAQLAVAEAGGAQLVRDEVVALRRAGNGFSLVTRGGTAISAMRVLVSAHGYSGPLLRTLLGRELAIENQAHTTVYAELRPEQAAPLATMPSLIWPLHNHPVLPSVYTTSPARYPDGRWYLKIGGPLHAPLVLESPAAIRAWFHSSGNPAEIAALRGVLQMHFPALDIVGWSSKPCMNSYTAHGYPYIDRLDDGLFVCTGGCGGAAKSSDAIGRLGAHLAHQNAWTDALPPETFRAVVR